MRNNAEADDLKMFFFASLQYCLHLCNTRMRIISFRMSRPTAHCFLRTCGPTSICRAIT
ncbi:unnamed protein product, partial [Nesidiocoris tenuis]